VADPGVPRWEADRAVEHPVAKAHILAQNRAAESFSEEREQAHPEAEGHAGADLAVWAQGAPAASDRVDATDRVTRAVEFRTGAQKTKTSLEF
jgi:hypothetical protein